jgi:hypothetical protein
MLISSELTAFRERNLVLECDEITLTQRLAGPTTRVLRGPGRLFQEDDGSIRFLVYVRDADSPGFAPYQVGAVLPEDAYYVLEAVDFQGRHWTCDQVKPGERHSGSRRFTVAHGRARVLRGEVACPLDKRQRYSLTGYVFSPAKFPANTRSLTQQERGRWRSTAGAWDTAEFEVDGINLHIHHDEPEEQLVLQAGADAPLPPQLGSRLIETLRFVLADLLWWDLLLEFEPGHERATLIDRAGPGARVTLPPIQSNYVETYANVERLFTCYLRYVLQAPDPELLHVLSAEWGEILRASAGTLQTQATIFCIGVEPLVRMVFAERRGACERDQTALDQVRAWTRRLREVLRVEECPEPLRARFDGLFSPMTGLSDRERLAWLSSRGAIAPGLITRWQRLRPVSAHGNREGQGEQAELYSECLAVLGLLYQLPAHLIGYEGMLTSFTEPGWPLRRYPLLPEGAAS